MKRSYPRPIGACWPLRAKLGGLLESAHRLEKAGGPRSGQHATARERTSKRADRRVRAGETSLAVLPSFLSSPFVRRFQGNRVPFKRFGGTAERMARRVDVSWPGGGESLPGRLRTAFSGSQRGSSRCGSTPVDAAARLLALRWEDIDLDSGTATVTRRSSPMPVRMWSPPVLRSVLGPSPPSGCTPPPSRRYGVDGRSKQSSD